MYEGYTFVRVKFTTIFSYKMYIILAVKLIFVMYLIHFGCFYLEKPKSQTHSFICRYQYPGGQVLFALLKVLLFLQ